MVRRHLLSVTLLLSIGLAGLTAADVFQHHLNATRDGLYVDPLITQAAAMTVHRDLTFSASLPAPTYAQPLYVANGPQGRAALIVAGGQDDVLALDAGDGSQIWAVNLGTLTRHLPERDDDPGWWSHQATPYICPVARRRIAARGMAGGRQHAQVRRSRIQLDGSEPGCPGTPGDLVALRINRTAPPTFGVAWCAANHGRGSPIVTTTDGSSNPIVWTIGAGGTNRLYAYDGETGETLFGGGGDDELMSPIRPFSTPIVADGRIFVAADSQLYAFTTQ